MLLMEMAEASLVTPKELKETTRSSKVIMGKIHSIRRRCELYSATDWIKVELGLRCLLISVLDMLGCHRLL